MDSNNKNMIEVNTTIKSNIEEIWKCWTKPEHIMKWNFASEEWSCPKVQNDLTPNGNFLMRMEAKDGSMGFDFTGIYENIIKNELITYKMSDGRLVKIEFTTDGNEVTISESFQAEGSNSDEQQRAGWQAILENFKKYVESRA